MRSHADARSSVGMRLDAPLVAHEEREGAGIIDSVAVGIAYNRPNKIRQAAPMEPIHGQRLMEQRCGAGRHDVGVGHRNNRGQWVLTIGAWHAVVQRVAPSRPMWQATLTRTTAPHDRYASQAYPEAVDARTWCLRKIAELTGAAP